MAERSAGTAENRCSPPLVMVVGFDGSPPALRAVDAAGRLLRGRSGGIHVVYVAHLPSGGAFSEDAVAELEAGFDQLQQTLSLETRTHLADIEEERWTFQRRDGEIARELIEVAEQFSSQRLPEEANTMIVVGSSTHKIHRLVGSVPLNLVRHAKFPIVIVP
jgi:nucleotide-binding universal stress UspA family protein